MTADLDALADLMPFARHLGLVVDEADADPRRLPSPKHPSKLTPAPRTGPVTAVSGDLLG